MTVIATDQSDTLNSLIELRDDLNRKDPAARLAALKLCRELQLELETPGETLIRITWAEFVHHWTLFSAALDLNIWEQLSENGGVPKTSSQLAQNKQVDPVMIGRIMRHLAAMGTVCETGPDTFAHTKFSQYLTTHAGMSALEFMRKFQIPVMKTPEFLAQRNYQTPTDPLNTVISWTFGFSGSTFFDHLSSNPKFGAAFAGMMRAESEGKPTWSDGQLYPVKEKLSDVGEPDGVLVVDIGAGNGHDLEWFRKNHPNLKGRLILQDLPYVTDKVSLEGIEAMAHNFYDEQPIKGAQVYILHQIIHDYDDETCVKILRAILPAMKKGYSKLLINELVVPDQGAHWFTTATDLLLMIGMAARERTQAQFIELVGKVGGGLKIEKIWTPSGTGMLDSIIECVIG